jgi:hypothetical protein
MTANLVMVFGARQLFFCEGTSFFQIFLFSRLQLRILDQAFKADIKFLFYLHVYFVK